MNCCYCNRTVIGKDAITIMGGAPAHSRCHQFELVSKRVFRGIPLTRLTDSELNELQEMLQTERNNRRNLASEIELF